MRLYAAFLRIQPCTVFNPEFIGYMMARFQIFGEEFITVLTRSRLVSADLAADDYSNSYLFDATPVGLRGLHVLGHG